MTTELPPLPPVGTRVTIDVFGWERSGTITEVRPNGFVIADVDGHPGSRMGTWWTPEHCEAHLRTSAARVAEYREARE